MPCVSVSIVAGFLLCRSLVKNVIPNNRGACIKQRPITCTAVGQKGFANVIQLAFRIKTVAQFIIYFISLWTKDSNQHLIGNERPGVVPASE